MTKSAIFQICTLFAVALAADSDKGKRGADVQYVTSPKPAYATATSSILSSAATPSYGASKSQAYVKQSYLQQPAVAYEQLQQAQPIVKYAFSAQPAQAQAYRVQAANYQQPQLAYQSYEQPQFSYLQQPEVKYAYAQQPSAAKLIAAPAKVRLKLLLPRPRNSVSMTTRS